MSIELDPPQQEFVFELHPFQQGREQSLARLGYHNLESLPVERTSSVGDGHFVWALTCRWGELTLTIGSLGGIRVRNGCFGWVGDSAVRYRLTDPDGRLVGGFVDAETTFQAGDAETTAHATREGALVIRNCGDVSSVVVIRRLH